MVHIGTPMHFPLWKYTYYEKISKPHVIYENEAKVMGFSSVKLQEYYAIIKLVLKVLYD
jgi:hypothetical protein